MATVSSRIPNFGALLRRHFFAGLLVVIPMGVIAWILASVIGALFQLHVFLPEAWRPETFLEDPTQAMIANLIIALAAALLLAMGVSLLGWASKQFIGRKILEFIASQVIQRIPVVRSIYSALDQLLRTMAAEGAQQFNRVVYIEYPRKGVWALGFVTGPAKGPAAPAAHLNVFVPTTPNPTSGFHLIVAESEVRDSHLAVEEAFRTILSLGIAQSETSNGELHGG
jgi:uncharacterized membrane protein